MSTRERFGGLAMALVVVMSANWLGGCTSEPTILIDNTLSRPVFYRASIPRKAAAFHRGYPPSGYTTEGYVNSRASRQINGEGDAGVREGWDHAFIQLEVSIDKARWTQARQAWGEERSSFAFEVSADDAGRLVVVEKLEEKNGAAHP